MREKYESLSLAVLKDLAKTRGLKGVSALKKADLIERMLQEDEKEVAVERQKQQKKRQQKRRRQKKRQSQKIMQRKQQNLQAELMSESANRDVTAPEQIRAVRTGILLTIQKKRRQRKN